MRGIVVIPFVCLGLSMSIAGAAPIIGRVAPPAPSVPDTLARRLAPCLACHGDRDNAAGTTATGERRYYPRIAGKPADYLFNQLDNFREGRRQVPLMTWMVAPLSDDYLREIAAWFAAQPAHPADAPAPMPAPVPADQLARGRRLALRGDPERGIPACMACHRERLTGALPAVPGLVGLPRDYINAQFGAWRNGTRRARAPDCMGRIAARLRPADVAAVSAWLAGQAAPQDTRPAPDVARPLPLACGSIPGGG